jgi:hypothetical protein
VSRKRIWACRRKRAGAVGLSVASPRYSCLVAVGFSLQSLTRVSRHNYFVMANGVKQSQTQAHNHILSSWQTECSNLINRRITTSFRHCEQSEAISNKGTQKRPFVIANRVKQSHKQLHNHILSSLRTE